jgi:hypothetical protein
MVIARERTFAEDDGELGGGLLFEPFEVDPFFGPRVKVEAGACSFNYGAKKNEGKAHETQSSVQGQGCIGGGARVIGHTGVVAAVQGARESDLPVERQLLENAERAFESDGGRAGDGAERESEFLQKIGELTVERDFLARGLGRLK